MSTRIAYNPHTGAAEFRYSEGAAEVVASSEYSDGANRLPGGTAAALVRTARGRYVWEYYSQWSGDPAVRRVAAMTAEGDPIDSDRVEAFLGRYGSDADVEAWREAVRRPIPLA